MKKIIKHVLLSLINILFLFSVHASPQTYTVVSGDSMWKIAVKYETGLDELIKANPQISNPSLIYPGQKISIPEASELISFEDEVINLVNIERSKNGLPELTKNWEASRVARIKSQDMINKNYFSHVSPTYGSPDTMMRNFGLISNGQVQKAHGQDMLLNRFAYFTYDR